MQPENCSSARLAIISGTGIEVSGLGSYLNIVLSNLWRARRTGRTPILHNISFGDYASPQICSGGAFECYFQWKGACKLSDAGDQAEWATDLRSSTRVAAFRMEIFGDYTKNLSNHWAEMNWDSSCSSVSSPEGVIRASCDLDPLAGHPLQQSHLFHNAEMLRAIPLQPWVIQIKHRMRSVIGEIAEPSFGSSPYAALQFRSTFLKKVEGLRQVPEQAVKAVRLALHGFGGGARWAREADDMADSLAPTSSSASAAQLGLPVVLLESDHPGALTAFRSIAPDMRWVWLPRCIFASLQSGGSFTPGSHVMDNLRAFQKANSSELSANCPAVSILGQIDEASVMLAVAELLGDAEPLVCGFTSNVCRLAYAMAARRRFLPPHADLDGGSFFAGSLGYHSSVCKDYAFTWKS